MSNKTFRGGVHPEGYKEISKTQPVEVFLPKGDMVYPLNQHIGKPAKPVVKKGDKVLAGQLIAEADGFVSANIVSSCSGTVKAIEERYVASGAKAMSIVIENDGEFTLAPGIGEERDPEGLSNEEVLDAIQMAGIVGMGVAAQEASEKLAQNIEKVSAVRDHLIARIESEIPHAKLNGHRAKRLPGNVNFCFRFVEGESMLMLLARARRRA